MPGCSLSRTQRTPPPREPPSKRRARTTHAPPHPRAYVGHRRQARQALPEPEAHPGLLPIATYGDPGDRYGAATKASVSRKDMKLSSAVESR